MNDGIHIDFVDERGVLLQAAAALATRNARLAERCAQAARSRDIDATGVQSLLTAVSPDLDGLFPELSRLCRRVSEMVRTTREARLLSEVDVSNTLGITVESVRLLIERHELPGIRDGDRWFVRAEELEEWLTRKDRGTPSGP